MFRTAARRGTAIAPCTRALFIARDGTQAALAAVALPCSSPHSSRMAFASARTSTAAYSMYTSSAPRITRGYLEAKRRRNEIKEDVLRSVRAAKDALRSERGWLDDDVARRKNDGVKTDAILAVDVNGEERCLRVGLLGAPNAGKSQLTNTLVGDKITAVSRKTNTTRTHTMGVKTIGDKQVVFVDAPGIVGSEHYRNAAHKRKVESAFGVASECDVLLFVVDAARHLERKDPRVLGIIEKTRNALSELLHEEYVTPEDGKSVIPEAILVLNKVDLIEKHRREELVRMVEKFQGKSFEFSRVFPISAMSGAGTKALMDHLLERAPIRPWDFDATKSSDMTDVQRALEIVREAVYNRVHEDIPYGIDIVHVSWEDFRNGDVRIEQNILVDTTSQRKIVVGKSGDAIGQIGINARIVLEAALGRKVHLILNVRMKKRRRNWGPVASRAEEY
jgi:GTPase